MKVPFTKLSSLADAIELLPPVQPEARDSVLYVDTETAGLYGKIRLVQLYAKGLPAVLVVEWPNPFELMMLLGKYNCVMHHAHYDITTIQTQTATRWVPASFEDTFLLARLAFPAQEEFSLDAVMSYCLPFDPYARQNLDKKTLQKSDWSKLILAEEQLRYAATDVYYLPDVFAKVQQCLTKPNYILDKSTLRTCLDFQWNGMPVDNERLSALYKANTDKINELAVPINVNSWQQVRPYIQSDQSDDLALAKLALQGNAKADAVRQTRKLRKQNSFLDKFEVDIGRIYGKFMPTARSGRLTSRDQNLQQIPRSTKTVFGYPKEAKRVLIYADYAQLELRTICGITKCGRMEQLFREGADLHGFTANMLFGQDWTAAQRQLSKTYNFSFLYGGGIGMLISILAQTANVLLSESAAQSDRRRWRALWPEIFGWQERGITAYQQGKLGSTPMGRQYKANMMTDQLNIENQGAGAEVAALALHYFKPHLDEYGQDAFLVNFVHDCFIIDAVDDPAVYAPVAAQLAVCMQTAWFELSKLLRIKDLPMPVEVKVGYYWGDMENKNIPALYTYKLEGMEMYAAI